MLVQSQSGEDYVRLFVADLVVDLSTPNHWLPGLESTKRLKVIDKMMHRLGFYRREKPRKTEWGWEATIRRRIKKSLDK